MKRIGGITSGFEVGVGVGVGHGVAVAVSVGAEVGETVGLGPDDVEVGGRTTTAVPGVGVGWGIGVGSLVKWGTGTLTFGSGELVLEQEARDMTKLAITRQVRKGLRQVVIDEVGSLIYLGTGLIPKDSGRFYEGICYLRAYVHELL